MESKKFKETVKTAIDKLENQGERCVDIEGQCLYFNPSSNHYCIVGHMMPVNVAKRSPNKQVQNLDWAEENFSEDQICDLIDLQKMHDRGIEEFPEKIKQMRELEAGL